MLFLYQVSVYVYFETPLLTVRHDGSVAYVKNYKAFFHFFNFGLIIVIEYLNHSELILYQCYTEIYGPVWNEVLKLFIPSDLANIEDYSL